MNKYIVFQQWLYIMNKYDIILKRGDNMQTDLVEVYNNYLNRINDLWRLL